MKRNAAAGFFSRLWFTLLLLCPGCDLLRQSPYEVSGWTPGEGFCGEPEKARVSLLLSHGSDKPRVEQAFSLTEDGHALGGNFSWEGARLIFTPPSPLEKNRDYRITLGAGAQDTRGLSLEKQFEASFTTRPPGGRPRLVSVEPAYDGIIEGSRGSLRLRFTGPLALSSCFSEISFKPSLEGTWVLEEGGTCASFTPREPWSRGAAYVVTLSAGLTGSSGLSLGEEYSSRFFSGGDHEKPRLTGAWALERDGGMNELAVTVFGIDGKPVDWEDGARPLYTRWEKDTRLVLDFSRPVDVLSVGSRLRVEPSASVVPEGELGFSSRVRFAFTRAPAWQSSFLFRLGGGVMDEAGNESGEEYVMPIRAGGEGSMPPVLIGICLPLAPWEEEEENQQRRCYAAENIFEDLPIGYEGDDIPSGDAGEAGFFPGNRLPYWIEMYFDTAPGARVDTFSLMELFRLETTNGALEFSPRSVEPGDETPDLPETSWKDYEMVKIRGFLTNRENSGVVNFRIGAGLRDSLSNINGNVMMISLLK
ncbi:MAG: Ig-like domain-containing protein [Treponema sp.]|jgi:hypothetical protein|nr:Ig-like domain-containing protein [Treponema sp.]